MYHRHGARLTGEDKIDPVTWEGDCMPQLSGVHQSNGIARLTLSDGALTKDGKCLGGQLTNFGRKQLRNLGTNLRELYFDRLGGVREGEFTSAATTIP